MFENPFYRALTTEHARFAVTNGAAVRYEADVIPFGGVAEPTPEAMRAFRDLIAPGEMLFTTGDAFPAVEGLSLTATYPGIQMRYEGATPAPDEDAPIIVPLSMANADEMLALKAVAFPGYFYRRAPKLGNFFGIRDEATGELIAMAGERASIPGWSEISAVCTHPAHTGRGHATRLMRTVMRTQADRGVGSMLSVLANNIRAIGIYQRMGFVTTGPLIFQLFQREP